MFGHISLSQIKRSGEDGRGLAIAGLVIGYLLTVLGALVLVFTFVVTRAIVEDIRQYNPNAPGYTAAAGGRRRSTAAVQAAGHPGLQLPVPEDLGAGRQTGAAAEDGQGADHAADGERCDHHRPRRDRCAPEQRAGAVHGEQFRQPGPEGLLQRHPTVTD